MSKYDCTKTIDYVHELKRMCAALRPRPSRNCLECPLVDLDCLAVKDITEKHIAIVQKWSDEHPEKPKLTKKERAFIDSFAYLEGKSVQNCGDIAYLILDNADHRTIMLAEGMFRFAETRMSLDELAELEVEDE